MKPSFRLPYFLFAVLFVAMVAMQIVLAGLAIFWRGAVWDTHGGLGHFSAIVPLVLLTLALVGRLPLRLRTWSGVLFAATVVQTELFVLIRELSGAAAAFHPLLAAGLFWGGIVLAQRAWSLVRQPVLAEAVAPEEAELATPARGSMACDPVTDPSC